MARRERRRVTEPEVIRSTSSSTARLTAELEGSPIFGALSGMFAFAQAIAIATASLGHATE